MKRPIRYKDSFHLSLFLCLYKHIQETKTLYQIEMLQDWWGWNTLLSDNSCRSFWLDFLSLNDVLTLLHMHIINPYFSMLDLLPGVTGCFFVFFNPDKLRHFALDTRDSLFFCILCSNSKQTTSPLYYFRVYNLALRLNMRIFVFSFS